MDKAGRRSIAIINRYLPPSSSITGDTAHEFYVALKTANPDIIVNQICVDDQYISDQSNLDKHADILRIPAIYRGKKKVLRFIGNFTEGFLLIRKAIKLKSDFVVTFTDPPLLNFWAACFLKKRGIKWIYWTMDLYPDAFVSASIISEKNIVFRMINKVLAKNLPDFVVGLGQEQMKYLFKRFNFKTDYTVIPCGIHDVVKSEKTPKWFDEKLIMFCYAGNLGEAHSIEFLKFFINRMNPEKHKLILSLYGSRAEEIMDYTKSKSNIVFTENVDRSELAYVDVHLVSLLPKWNHVCVPSKAVSAICSGSTILFCGSREADTWMMLKEYGWNLPYTTDPNQMSKEVQSFLNFVSKEEIEKIKSIDRSSFKNMQLDGYQDVFEFIRNT